MNAEHAHIVSLKRRFLSNAFRAIGAGQDVRGHWAAFVDGLERERTDTLRVMVVLGELGTAWWRAFIPFMELVRSRELDVRMSMVLSPDDLGWADVIWLQRPGQHSMPSIVDSLKLFGRGARLVIDNDDWLRGVPPYNPFALHIEEQGVRRVFDEMLLFADVVCFSTLELARLYGLEAEAVILPNAIDEDLWPLDEDTDAIRTKFLTIGWAGSPTHSGDLEMVLPALAYVLEQNPDLAFVRIGAWGMQTAHELALLPRDRVIEFSFEPHSHELPKYLRFLDVGLAPLVDNAFNRAKSNCKWLEYGAMRIPTIASRLEPYKAHDGALVLADHDNWAEALGMMIGSVNLRRSLGREARREVLSNWTIRKISKLWIEALSRAMV